MKIILNHDVINLGEEGDVREVADGYARNYLIAKGMAAPYTKQNLLILDSKRVVIENRKEEKRTAALGVKEKLETEQVKFSMSAGENGKLFGSVNSSLIAEELEKKGYSFEKKRIEVPDNHIREIGEYTVKVKLYGQEEANVTILVERAAP